MKTSGLFKILNIAAILLLTAATAMAAGTVTQSVTMVCEPMSTNCFKVLTFVCTGDASTGSYPSTAVTTANMDQIKGWYLLMGTSYNGSTAPTALYDVTLTDARGVDVLGTSGTNRPGTAGVSSQFTPITDTTYATGGIRPIASTLTLAIANNSQASAVTTLDFFFVK
jgi:hypothetical protein